jgi:hypothetical protein
LKGRVRPLPRELKSAIPAVLSKWQATHPGEWAEILGEHNRMSAATQLWRAREWSAMNLEGQADAARMIGNYLRSQADPAAAQFLEVVAL